MTLYKKDNLEISLIEENDIEEVIKIFESFDFNVNCDTGDRPISNKFERIIRENLERSKKLETVLVLKIDGKIIGYLSCFVSYSQLVLGHIAIHRDYQHRGYGRLLTLTSMYLASKSNRDVSLICNHTNHYLSSLGFKTHDGIHYTFKGRLENDCIPDVFINIEDYKKLKEKESEERVESFKRFLKSPLGKDIMNL